MQYLYGMHDPGGEHLFADRKGWITFTEAIGSDPNDKSGRDYRQWSDAGYGVLVRLNNGYGSAGTIPTPEQYGNFAWRVAHFVAASKGADTWIIGNETNHSNERPNGQPITVEMYVDCFKQVHAAVRDHAGTRHGLIPAPVALWNVETGDWLEYQERVWNAVWRLSAGFAIHTYTHGAAVNLITSMERMAPPFADRFYHFMAYRQFMTRVPQSARGLPVYITETDQNDPWVDANTGWVQAAYDEIDRWNATDGTQKIYCLCLYRWPTHDQWSIGNKPGVHADLRAAVGREFRAPVKGKEQMDTHIPVVSPGTSNAEPSLSPRTIDPRATQRGVTIEMPQVAPGQTYWRVKEIRWYDEQEADRLGPDHHIMADVLDEQGKRVVGVPLIATWPHGEHLIVTEAKPGELYSANYPMSPSRNEFSIEVVDGTPSEAVKGIGMGMDTPGGFNAGIHTSTGVVFQRATMPAVAVPAQPPIPGDGPTPVTPPTKPTRAWIIAQAGANFRQSPTTESPIVGAVPYGDEILIIGVESIPGWVRVRYGNKEGYMASDLIGPVAPKPLPAPTEPTPEPVNERDNWTRAIAFVRRWEGGWADNPADPGGATNKGITIGTFKAWRAARGQQTPTKEDLRNISDEEVNRIFYEWYWLASGADRLSWPLCLCQMDTAVNAGVGKAQEMLTKSNGIFLAYMGHLITWYTEIKNFETFGRAWIRRRADILLEASKT